MQISLGPVLYYWDKPQLQSFYAAVADLPLTTVYLGEVVCSKRRSLRWGEWLELAGQLSAAGKQVVMSTLTLIEAQSELSSVERACHNGEFLVEANDMAAVQFCSERGLPFVSGPHINLYNGRALRFLQKQGLCRWLLPLELSREQLQQIQQEAQALSQEALPELEVFGHGLMPLAHSARCFTARHHNLPKDRCEFRCLADPDGLPVYSQDGEALFTLNGIQTQSARCLDLRASWQDMQQRGVSAFRFSPTSTGCLQRIRDFAASMKAQTSPDQNAGGTDDCNGYWFGKPGMIHVAEV
ncbi:U32 family peptidase [Permianibacter sp. IMCC34836]|uniref:U32 family peptidase n=1 Tax=Permianibacter fluminis TaxID=2738515 RepID=UPI001557B438|nr:U32 family peptidase [Permianibacter fluminis]NQD37891.1 U32 family peptidase [Permianibacter fluminis]